MQKRKRSTDASLFKNTPKGIRIPVASVKGRCPRPLDDGGLCLFAFLNLAKQSRVCQGEGEKFFAAHRRPSGLGRSPLRQTRLSPSIQAVNQQATAGASGRLSFRPSPLGLVHSLGQFLG